jgi:carbonic anhydrase
LLQDLIEGNSDFIRNEVYTINHKALIYKTTDGQHPKAIVLSCIDSKVPVALIFDQTIGDAFVARVAGNFKNTDILGSIKYSCKVAESKLVFVLEHESCAVIKSACDHVKLKNINVYSKHSANS